MWVSEQHEGVTYSIALAARKLAHSLAHREQHAKALVSQEGIEEGLGDETLHVRRSPLVLLQPLHLYLYRHGAVPSTALAHTILVPAVVMPASGLS